MDFRKKVLNIVSEICENDIVLENPDIELFEENILDSFGVVNLLVSFSDELGIEVPLSDFDRDEWKTPNLIVKKMESYQ